SVLLEESARITRNARCHRIYRYQEWQDSLHDVDGRVILSLELCVYLRASSQNNVSVSKMLNSLEVMRKVTCPARDTILQ
ncbi:hypothetical protein KUCAC02_002666, partial [Chaenocephalus aceratus]